MRISNIVLIGCGGIGSYLAPVLSKVLCHGKRFKETETKVILWDGDVVEQKNLERQAFGDKDVGRSKPDVLCQHFFWTGLRVEPRNMYIHDGCDVPEDSCIFVCADNHPARATALKLSDKYDAPCIVAANGETSAQAYLYLPEWQGSKLDPRIRYPEILTDKSHNPIAASAGCNATETLEKTGGQTALANFQAAAHAMLLFSAHIVHEKDVDEEFRDELPIELISNFASTRTIKIKDIQ